MQAGQGMYILRGNLRVSIEVLRVSIEMHVPALVVIEEWEPNATNERVRVGEYWEEGRAEKRIPDLSAKVKHPRHTQR